jgi:hypothetical protein
MKCPHWRSGMIIIAVAFVSRGSSAQSLGAQARALLPKGPVTVDVLELWTPPRMNELSQRLRNAAQADPATSLGRECITHRASGSRGTMGRARFAMERADNRFRPRSAALTRRVVCGFRGGKLVSATEQFYLQLISEDRENPGFTTGAPNMSARFYIVCEGGMRTTLPTFVEGQVLSFADNTFTLPCGHAIYPADVHDPAKANRITGLYSYKVRSATLAVRMGPTVERPTFDVTVDALVENPNESLHLRGRVSGRLSMVFAIVDCPTVRLHTKQAQHPGCP